MTRKITLCVRALAAAALTVAAGVAVQPAGAADLDVLRARAQAVADEVTALEERLAELEAEQDRLGAKIQRADAEIGVLELEIHDTEAALADAEERFVERAVEAYKSGSTGVELEMMLSTTDLSQLLTLSEANANQASVDEQVLEELVLARDQAEDAQDRVDARKQELLAAQARVEAIGTEMKETVDDRHETLARLTEEIEELERQARIEARRLARQAATTDPHAFADLVGAGGPAPGIPNGFTSTGVSFEGTASWYGPGFEGNPTASGQIFDSSLFTAASRDLPLGTWLYVTYNGRGVIVLVNDRGPYIDDRVLDLSRAAAETLGITGLGWVRAEIVVKT